MTVGELYSALNDKFPTDYSCEWDNDGLMYCFDKSKEAKKVLISLDVTLDAIDYAVNNGYDTIVSHHPLIFKPLTCLDFEGATGKRIKKLIKHDITVISFHTRLDCVAVNQLLAENLGLVDIESFYLDDVPIGRVGVLEKEMTVLEFAEYIKSHLDCRTVEFSGKNCKTAMIKRVAVLGGSGGDAVSYALKCRADALVTGECSYNKIIDAADVGVYVFTAGHYETEKNVCYYLYETIKELDENTVCEVYNPTPILNL